MLHVKLQPRGCWRSKHQPHGAVFASLDAEKHVRSPTKNIRKDQPQLVSWILFDVRLLLCLKSSATPGDQSAGKRRPRVSLGDYSAKTLALSPSKKNTSNTSVTSTASRFSMPDLSSSNSFTIIQKHGFSTSLDGTKKDAKKDSKSCMPENAHRKS